MVGMTLSKYRITWHKISTVLPYMVATDGDHHRARTVVDGRDRESKNFVRKMHEY